MEGENKEPDDEQKESPSENAPDVEQKVSLSEKAPDVEQKVSFSEKAPDVEQKVSLSEKAPDDEQKVSPSEKAPDSEHDNEPNEPKEFLSEKMPDGERDNEPNELKESLSEKAKANISKTGSKISVKEAYSTGVISVKSFSPKTHESKTTNKDDNLVPAFNAKNDVKVVYQSRDEIVNSVRQRRSGGGLTTEGGHAGISGFGCFPCSSMFSKRSPFIHNPPHPEVPRARIDHPRSPKDYIINLREDLADFQESRGLPRTRDYSFLSLGMALVQETARTVCSLFLMFAELFPILAVISLIVRFALDKIIEILETPDTVSKLKKAAIFGLQMLLILIPLWILIGTILIPFVTLIFSILQRMLRIKGGKKKSVAKPKTKSKVNCCDFF